jgi:hypothetical protein
MPMLNCPNNPEHKEFVMIVMAPETWILNEDGDCEEIVENSIDYEHVGGYEEIVEGSGNIESDLTDACCQTCGAPVEITAEDN